VNSVSGVTLITGVGKGFGRELFVHRVKNFGNVVGFTRSREDIVSLENELADEVNRFFLFDVDVTDYASVNQIILDLRTRNLEVINLINNAGMRYRKPYLEIANEDLQAVFNNNVVSIHNLCKACIPTMLKHGRGRIVNISSILGEIALPDLAGYNISKGALNSLTQSLAVDFAERNITVNGVAPGFCKTSYYGDFKQNEELHEGILGRIPMKRWGESSEIVGICDFLLSDSAGYITGTTIPVDGGWLAC
jgi:NAD(P)-dependent dehydrogenase (short-subunit alcohol dehydrogenase family)